MFLLFEVMDKEPSLSAIWVVYLVLGVGGFLLARVDPSFLAIILPLVALFGWLNWSELNAPFISDDIIREAGYSYVIQNYIAIFIGTALPIAGAFVWIWRKTRKPLLS